MSASMRRLGAIAEMTAEDMRRLNKELEKLRRPSPFASRRVATKRPKKR